MVVVALLLLAFADSGADLHKAVRAHDHAAVRQLIDQGAPVNDRDPLGGTPLHDAAWAGDTESAEILIAHGADVNARHAEAGSTPLHYAIITNHLEVLKLLVEHGADIKATSRTGTTPLQIAANHGYVEIAEYPDRPRCRCECSGFVAGASALDEAAWRGQTALVSLLLSNGAKVNEKNADGGYTPLHEAAIKGHDDTVQVLIAAGADLNARDGGGWTPLDCALHYQQSKVAETLLDRGAKAGGESGPNALHEAVMRGQTDVVQLLLKRIQDVNALRYNGSTLLHDAALKNRREIAEILIAKGADVNARNSIGSTPLHDAALAGSLDVAAVLIAHGANVNAQDTESGATPLHNAASWGRLEVVRLLLDKGADRTIKNKEGRTPADLASLNTQTAVVDLLSK